MQLIKQFQVDPVVRTYLKKHAETEANCFTYLQERALFGSYCQTYCSLSYPHPEMRLRRKNSRQIATRTTYTLSIGTCIIKYAGILDTVGGHVFIYFGNEVYGRKTTLIDFWSQSLCMADIN